MPVRDDLKCSLCVLLGGVQIRRGLDSTMRDSSATRVLPTRPPADQPRRASGCGLLPILCYKFQTLCLGRLPALEARTNEWGRAPRAAGDCLGPTPWPL